MRDSPEVTALIARVIPQADRRRVFNLMRTRPLRRSNGNANLWFRIIDIQKATGHNSDEQRLRELRRDFKEMFRIRKVTYPDRGGSHYEHQLRRDWQTILRGYERGTL